MKKPSRFLVYALHRDDSSRVYVGKSTSGMRRPNGHAYPSSMKNNQRLPLYRWLAKYDSKYRISILEECSKDTLSDAEIFYISYFKSIGMKLLNCTRGGEGLPGLVRTEEHKRKLSESSKGRKASIETRQKQSLIRRALRDRQGCMNLPETREKISKGLMGHTTSPETRLKIGLAHRGMKRSASAVEKMAAAHRGLKRTPEMKSRQSIALGGCFLPHMYYDGIPEFMKAWRMSLGLSARKSAMLFGITTKTLEYYESGW